MMPGDRAVDLDDDSPRKGVVLMEVASESRPDRWYKIYRQPDGSLFCSCPDYIFRRQATRSECKHLRALRLRQGLRAAPVPPQADAAVIALPRFLVLDL